MENLKPDNRKMPAEQALIFVIQKAILCFDWIKMLQIEWEKSLKENKDGSQIREQQQILVDIFTVYINSLIDRTKGTHSLIRSYDPNDFIKKIEKNPFVRLCKKHRDNRAGHQSENYGSIINLDVLLGSNLDKILKDLFYMVGTRSIPKKK